MSWILALLLLLAAAPANAASSEPWTVLFSAGTFRGLRDSAILPSGLVMKGALDCSDARLVVFALGSDDVNAIDETIKRSGKPYAPYTMKGGGQDFELIDILDDIPMLRSKRPISRRGADVFRLVGQRPQPLARIPSSCTRAEQEFPLSPLSDADK